MILWIIKDTACVKERIMKKNYICAMLIVIVSFFAPTLFAWNQSVELGYGISHDPNNTHYNNSGVLLSGDLYPLWRNTWSFLSVNGGLGQWYSTAPSHKNLTTVALGLALRLYVYDIATCYPAYFLGTVAPAYLSDRKFGTNTQGSNLSIQTNLGLGVEFSSVDVNLRLAHFSNANLAKPNEGFNVLYLLSIGYLF